MADTKLLPCPFCGAPAHGYAIEPHSRLPSLMRLIPELPDHPGCYVIEGQCSCGSVLIGADETEVVARWNRLAPKPAPAPLSAVLAKWGTPAVAGKPVAWLSPWRADQVTTDYDAYGEHGIPLYTASQPVERDPLSPERVKEIVLDAGYDQCDIPDSERAAFIDGLRHGEEAHGITHNGGSDA